MMATSELSDEESWTFPDLNIGTEVNSEDLLPEKSEASAHAAEEKSKQAAAADQAHSLALMDGSNVSREEITMLQANEAARLRARIQQQGSIEEELDMCARLRARKEQEERDMRVRVERARMTVERRMAELNDNKGARPRDTFWKCLGLFDSATPAMKQQRNKAPEGLVLQALKATSQNIEPVEYVYDSAGRLQEKLYIAGVPPPYEDLVDGRKSSTPKTKPRNTHMMSAESVSSLQPSTSIVDRALTATKCIPQMAEKLRQALTPPYYRSARQLTESKKATDFPTQARLNTPAEQASYWHQPAVIDVVPKMSNKHWYNLLQLLAELTPCVACLFLCYYFTGFSAPFVIGLVWLVAFVTEMFLKLMYQIMQASSPSEDCGNKMQPLHEGSTNTTSARGQEKKSAYTDADVIAALENIEAKKKESNATKPTSNETVKHSCTICADKPSFDSLNIMVAHIQTMLHQRAHYRMKQRCLTDTAMKATMDRFEKWCHDSCIMDILYGRIARMKEAAAATPAQEDNVQDTSSSPAGPNQVTEPLERDSKISAASGSIASSPISDKYAALAPQPYNDYCRLCPGKPTFTTRDDMLTHECSREHIMSLFELEAEATNSIVAKATMKEYRDWFNSNNISKLMWARQNGINAAMKGV